MEIITPYDKIPRPESVRDCVVLHYAVDGRVQRRIPELKRLPGKKL
jgi:hypothetical protein